MRSLYEGEGYAQKNPTWHEEDAPWKARHIQTILERNGVDCSSICEIGCGTGEVLLNLGRSFPNAALSGFEISPQAFERATQKQTPSTRFYMGDLFDQDSHFDVVLAIDVMEHVEDYISFIKKLKAFGTFKVFHIPLDLSVQSVFRLWPILQLRKDVGHLHYFFKQSAIATLEDCGYTIIDHCYTASRLELPNQVISSRMMRFPRQLMFALNPDFAVRLLGGYSLLVLAK